MIKKTPKISHKNHQKNKKKLPLFFKILLSVAIFFGLVLFYFIVLVSSSPRSIDFVTNKIQKNLDSNFQNRVKISQTLVKFTTYGSFRIEVQDIKISYKDIKSDSESKSVETVKYFYIPRIEAEFSLFDLILLKFNPNKIKIFKPEILVENTDELNNFLKNNPQNNDSSTDTNQQIRVLLEFLSSFRKNKNPIENFEIEDAKIIFQTPKINSELIIKNAKISTKINRDALDIFMQGQIYFTSNASDFKIDSNCKLSNFNGLKCDINIFNFVPKSIAIFHPILDDLKNIDTTLNGSLNLEINGEKSLNNLSFNLRADKGSFEFKNFFKDKIDFRQMKIIGDFDGVKKILKLKNVNSALISNIANQTEILNPQLDLGLTVSILENQKAQYDFEIGLENVLTNEIDRFWPITLSQNGVRDWVVNHINNGVIKKAYTKFSILEDSLESNLENINAQLDFENIDLNYDQNFPEITNLFGIAVFSKNDMKIFINSGNVLKSQIYESEVSIDDFNMPINILRIIGNVSGGAQDGLKHASNNTEFQGEIDKYLNGSAKSSFEIMIPLVDKIALKDTFIGVKSNLFGINNNFIKGDLIISTKKDLGSNVFNTLIDLKNCSIDNKELKIFKKNLEDGQLSFGVDVGDKSLAFKNIFYTNFIPKNIKNIAKNNKKIEANLEFSYEPFNLIKLNINNQNIGKNNYNLSYLFDNNKSDLFLSLRGKNLDASSLIGSKIFINNSKNSAKNIKINIGLNNLELANKKQLNNVNLNLVCVQKICNSGSLSAVISKQKKSSKNINFKIVKNGKKDEYLIEGQIQDLGFMTESLGISNLVSGGVGKINVLQSIVDQKLVLSGNMNVSSDITIFESEAVKKLSSNNLFSQIRDKIFSSEKTTFSSVVVDFVVKDSDLILKSLIANNFKIGITAKGKINLKDNSAEIKGMIVPGYIINSLFGLGKIPVLGNVISGVLTGGEGGGIFSIRYEYLKTANDKEGKFSTNKVSAFVPSSISSLFD
ncbi:MAG: hypothetical protein FJX30_04330 [Alphaproteobacteria bacterium]|nr:hypothetical protein [Alphaproteobacteria bacterium]